LFHPDSNQDTADHDTIAHINAAYEVLGDPQRRQTYDQDLQYYAHLEAVGVSVEAPSSWEQRTAAAQAGYRKRQKAAQDADQQIQAWLKQVYTPVCRLIQQILQPLKTQINQLAADPFDDELMAEFLAYLEDCRDRQQWAEKTFRSMPNPPTVAGVAAHLYYCLNQVNDGLEQLEIFTTNYEESYLHTGQELFRIATGLRREAQIAVKDLGV